MNIDAEPCDQGIRLKISDAGNEILQARVSDNGSSSVSLFWTWRTDLKDMFSFFDENCPETPGSSFEVIIYAPTERIEIKDIPNAKALLDRLPEDLMFGGWPR